MGDISKYFDRAEFSCRCNCGRDDIDLELVDILESIREFIGKPIIITSGVRCDKHNLAEGGKLDSAHLSGKAVDIRCDNSTYRYNLISYAISQGIMRIGIAKTFIHIDIDDNKPQEVIWLY